jgi:hypothetical protein
MWYSILITLVVDIGGLLVIYAVLRDRVRRATSAATQIAELRDEVSRLVVELNQTTERNVALLEDRISGLSDLLGAADRKIALLAREIEKHDVGAKVYSRLAPGQAAADSPGSHLSVELSEGKRAQSPAEEPSPKEPSPKAPSVRETAASRQDMRQRVVMLSRSGFSPHLIATRVGIPLGEVELIISLERQRGSTRSGEEPA